MNLSEIKKISNPDKRLQACRSFVSIGRGTFGELGWARGEVRAILKAQREAAPKTDTARVRTLLAATLEPQRQGFVDYWVGHEREYIEQVKADMAAAGWDLDAMVKDPYERGITHEEKGRRHNRRDYLTRPLASDREANEAAKEAYTATFRAKDDYAGYNPNFRRCFYKADAAQEEKLLKQAAEDAGAHFDSFINKMSTKVGEDTAEVVAFTGLVWSNCDLTVRKAGGATEKWHTKMILNRSVLGTLFNQWPTRKVG